MKVNVKQLSYDQCTQFVDGWLDAGGYIGDFTGPNPWAMPWLFTDYIDVAGDTPAQWGADWWAQCKQEVLDLLQYEDALQTE